MFRARTLAQLQALRARLASRRVVVGFDGFVDTIVTPVALRQGQGENFSPIATIREFGERILGAAGKSTNIELFPRFEKLGGNGPIMANALLAAGAPVTFIGAVGRPRVHPVFADMAAKARTFPLCAPAQTTAAEFADGKLMLGMMRSLDEVTFERIAEAVGGEAALRAEFADAAAIALVNWTMLPNMTAIFEQLAARVLPQLPEKERIFFFDLADPEKRSPDDLREALTAVARFEAYGRVTLGMNLKEAQQVCAALGLPAIAENETGLKAAAAGVRAKLGVAMAVIHPRESAACASATGSWWVPGPYTTQPKLTTGAGDHFNAGFTAGQLLGADPEACLGLGVCMSGHYVRTGESPTLATVETFLANWR